MPVDETNGRYSINRTAATLFVLIAIALAVLYVNMVVMLNNQAILCAELKRTMAAQEREAFFECPPFRYILGAFE